MSNKTYQWTRRLYNEQHTHDIYFDAELIEGEYVALGMFAFLRFKDGGTLCASIFRLKEGFKWRVESDSELTKIGTENTFIEAWEKMPSLIQTPIDYEDL